MEKETFGSLFNSIKEHFRQWFEARINVIQLKLIRLVSNIAGNMAWLVISLFLFLLLSVFIGLTLGFWLSSYLGSYEAGFGVVALLILLKIILLAAFRRKLFVNPIIRFLIKQVYSEFEKKEETTSNN